MSKYCLQVYSHTLSNGQDEAWVDVESLGIHPDIAIRLADLGILEIRLGLVPAGQAGRIQALMRLRRNLGVNLAGAAIILDLLDRMERLQDELDRLKRR